MQAGNGLCLTAFLQATVLIAGLMVVKDQALLGLGLMLSAGEIPRIAGQFGLETGTKANVMGAVYAAQGAMNLTRTVVQVVSKLERTVKDGTQQTGVYCISVFWRC